MNCQKHGFDWPHDKTCPYCTVESLTTENSILRRDFGERGEIIRSLNAKVAALREKITEIHWCCGRDDLLPSNVLPEIIGICDRVEDGKGQ